MGNLTLPVLLTRVRALLGQAQERQVDHEVVRVVLPAECDRETLADLLHALDAHLTGAPRDYLECDYPTAVRAVAELDEFSRDKLLADVLARRAPESHPTPGGAPERVAQPRGDR